MRPRVFSRVKSTGSEITTDKLEYAYRKIYLLKNGQCRKDRAREERNICFIRHTERYRNISLIIEVSSEKKIFFGSDFILTIILIDDSFFDNSQLIIFLAKFLVAKFFARESCLNVDKPIIISDFIKYLLIKILKK